MTLGFIKSHLPGCSVFDLLSFLSYECHSSVLVCYTWTPFDLDWCQIGLYIHLDFNYTSILQGSPLPRLPS